MSQLTKGAKTGGAKPDLSWRDAIVNVLTGQSEPMHYSAIAEAITERSLRKEVGATPAATVNATICMSFEKDGEGSPFQRVSRGHYALKSKPGTSAVVCNSAIVEEAEDTGLIHAFGMYWNRNGVLWSSTPRILGQQQLGSTPADFCAQHGVYLLHDGRAVVYVGRTTDQTLGARLKQHTCDRLKGRWDRFSWFGVYAVDEGGKVKRVEGPYNLEMLIITMEALLIEGLEPPQNRKRGDEFKAVEFLQVDDPEIEKKRKRDLLDEMKRNA